MHTNHLIGRRRHKGSTCFALCSRRLACTSLVAAIILIGHTDSAITAPAVNITYVGQAALANYRTTTSLKPLDLDGDNVFGTAGYVFYGTDVLNNSNGGSVSTTDPLAYSSGTRRTKLSLPAWLTLFNNGQNRIATSYPSYPVIDDPALVPSPSVTDLQLGVAVRDPVLHGTEASFVNIRLNTGMPAGGVRVGVACFAGTGDAIDLIRLTNNFNAGAVVTRTATGAPVLYFFDVTGAQPGDIVTLRLSKNPSTGGNTNLAYIGLTFDRLPLPPRITSLSVVDDTVTVKWDSEPGRRYRVETKSSLTAPLWIRVGSDIIASDTTTSLTVPGGTGLQGFYRVVLLPDS